jgi:hypothetical protein
LPFVQHSKYNDFMNRAKFICSLLFSCALAERAFGVVYTIDQAYTNQTPPFSIVSIAYGNPIGQGFTPTLNSLSFVDLFTQDTTYPGTGGVVSVEIHSQTINGPILGVSAPDSLPAGFFGITHFTFATPVPLQPGSPYFIQIIQNSGDYWGVGVISPNNPPYPGGPEIVQGTVEIYGDLWFDEGIISVPEPSVLALFCAAASLLLAKSFPAQQNHESKHSCIPPQGSR